MNKEEKQTAVTNESVCALLSKLAALFEPGHPALQSFGTWNDISGRDVKELVRQREEAERLILEGYKLLASLPIIGVYPDFDRLSKKSEPSLEECLDFLLCDLRLGAGRKSAFFDFWKDGTAKRISERALSLLEEYDLTQTERLSWLEQLSAGQTVKPLPDALSIGRGKKCQSGDFWTVDSPSVSRVHAMVERKKGSEDYTVRDCGSVNGSFVNGTKLTPDKPQTLRDGDVIRLADEGFVYHRARCYRRREKA